MDKLGINLGYLIMQIVLFTILFLVLRNYLYEPLLRTLDERKTRIAKGMEDARQAAIARDNADAEAKKILEAARADAAKIRAEAANKAEEQASEIVSRAHDEAKTVVVNASTDAEGERNRILSELRGQVASISIAAANKLVGESLDEKRQHALIADFFAKVPASVSSLTGSAAEVTSALPLTDAEKTQARSSIGADSVDFKVNPDILGGLVVRVGDQVVDNSVAGQMGAMKDTLN